MKGYIMKKLIWFTTGQVDLLIALKRELGLNNAEVVREGMKLLADKHSIKYGNIDAIKHKD
jgi:hypothetical protein